MCKRSRWVNQKKCWEIHTTLPKEGRVKIDSIHVTDSGLTYTLGRDDRVWNPS